MAGVHSAAVTSPYEAMSRATTTTTQAANTHALLQAMRRDTNLMAAADYHCADMDISHLGRHMNINAKKARGLMRAGGEASRHLYTDWPHDFVLVGSDNDRVFYKDLTIEQWSYGFLAIIEKEVNPVIQANMISHLKCTYMDAILYGFRRAKYVHRKILTEIEDGRLTWMDADRIAETQKTRMQRPLTLEDYREQQRQVDDTNIVKDMVTNILIINMVNRKSALVKSARHRGIKK
jgi:hypothetical protein